MSDFYAFLVGFGFARSCFWFGGVDLFERSFNNGFALFFSAILGLGAIAMWNLYDETRRYSK